MSIAVFFTCDIPEKTLNRFLDAGQAHLDDSSCDWRNSKTKDIIGFAITIVTSKDYSQYPTRTTRPFEPFDSPFTGESPEQIASWFRGVTDPHDVKRPFPGVFTFIILDEQTVKDNQSCLLVGLSTQFAYEPVQTMRCDFYIVHSESANYEYGSQHFAFDYAGYFMRSRLVVTKKNQRLAERWSFLPIVNGAFTDDGKNRYGEGGDEYIQEY
ncbi:hypothetical protein CPB83DRAFT_895752 [Crepidotus variabilis]|uniref:Uncharacterized protein n=1 Tax=Crepidotus variabilis TaxID=179855 RepID=A0A9P6EDE3_9AGAR|nr:hypothetical protein CPB83DRAFT_895752 [Crepidotus variabilis]